MAMVLDQIERVLMGIDGVGNNFVIVLETEDHVDQLRLKIEVTDEVINDGTAIDALKKTIIHELKSEILITPRLELVGPELLPRSVGKAVRVIDEREG